MNAPDRLPVSELALERDGASYAFFQLMRLLRLHYGSFGEYSRHVRVRPNLSFAFPGRDIEQVERIAVPVVRRAPPSDRAAHEGRVSERIAGLAGDTDTGAWRVTANFFGLYGVSSPLPAFYTEDLFEEQRAGRTASRDLLDLLHAALYPMLQRAWEKYRLWLRIGEQNESACLDLLLALIGRMDANRPAGERQTDAALLPYASLFAQRPRSALALQSFISARLSGAAVTVVACLERRIAIPPEAQCQLGGTSAPLGDALVGEQLMDRRTAFALEIGPLEQSRFHALLPDGVLHRRLVRDVSSYLDTWLACVVRLELDPRDVGPATLGTGLWSRLGLDTWLGGGPGSQAGTGTARCVANFGLPAAPAAALPANANAIAFAPAGAFSDSHSRLSGYPVQGHDS